MLLFIQSCSDSPGNDPDPEPFEKGETWLYQLQSADPAAINQAGFNMAVIDYSRGGDDATAYTSSELNGLNSNGIEALAYLSIGEAENYRFYWISGWVQSENSNNFTASAPAWLGHTNPDWLGNYKVRYWDSDWRDNYIKPYLDRIIAQGFHGVYLDIVDGFEYWSDPDNYGGSERESQRAGDPYNDEQAAGQRMIELVEWIAGYCRSNSTYGADFRIFPQNGVRILDYDSDNSYLATISGIGVEDVWFDELTRINESETAERLGYLRRIGNAGKTVLSVDYVDSGSGDSSINGARMRDYATRARAEGFRYYIARRDRELDRINQVPALQP